MSMLVLISKLEEHLAFIVVFIARTLRIVHVSF